MALYLARAGRYGEHEETFLQGGFISVAWGNGFQEHDLSGISRERLKVILEQCYPDEKPGKIRNWLGQISVPVLAMRPSDLVVMPSKIRPTVAVGVVRKGYYYSVKAAEGYRHRCDIDWKAPSVPRSRFKQDMLYSFGAFMTFCEIKRNNAEDRVRTILESGTEKDLPAKLITTQGNIPVESDMEDVPPDLQQVAADQLALFLETTFKGDRLEVLIEEIFKAQGYFTYRSPRGADRGVDVLAAKGALGFESPKICIQVKSGGTVERKVMHELQGTMHSVGADYGLLVSWDGFARTVEKDERQSRFFNIRLWDSGDILEQIQRHYDSFSDAFKTELPLKRLWVLAENAE